MKSIHFLKSMIFCTYRKLVHFVMVNLIDLKRILYNGITTKYDYINFWITTISQAKIMQWDFCVEIIHLCLIGSGIYRRITTGEGNMCYCSHLFLFLPVSASQNAADRDCLCGRDMFQSNPGVFDCYLKTVAEVNSKCHSWLGCLSDTLIPRIWHTLS